MIQNTPVVVTPFFAQFLAPAPVARDGDCLQSNTHTVDGQGSTDSDSDDKG